MLSTYNPNTFTGMVGKVPRRKEGRMEKKRAQRARGGRGSNPGPTYRVLGEGPQLHATGFV